MKEVHGTMSPQTKNIHAQKNVSYGMEIPSKDQLKAIKKKVQLLKEAIVKQRQEREEIEKDMKNLSQKYGMIENNLQKRQQKNQVLLHESRSLKDILIRQKQQIIGIQMELKKMKQKSTKDKVKPQSSQNNQQSSSTDQNWKSYLTSFWK